MEKEKEKEKEIFPKILEIKDIIQNKIKSFEDFELNKIIILSLIEQTETILNQIFNKEEIPIKEEIKENINNNDEIKVQENSNDNNNIDNNTENNNNININNNIEEKNIELKTDKKIDIENNENINNINNNNDEDNNENNSLPKLNFDYDKNINEILGHINMEKNIPLEKASLENNRNNNILKKEEKEKEIPIKMKEIPEEENMKLLDLQNNGYSKLFSFNQDLSNIIPNKSSFTTEDYSLQKNKIMNSNKKEKEKEKAQINNNNSIQSEENIYRNIYNNNETINEVNENIKNSKALRVADIIMKINSNEILCDIITQIYSKEILDQLLSPDVDINLIEVIEQAIEKITILENEEIQKLRNKEPSIQSNINNNINNNNENINNNDINKRNTDNINNYNKLNIPKKINNEYKKYKSSSSFYDKSKNNSINSISSIYYSNYAPKKISSYKKSKSKTEIHLNSEILKNYPKTGKTILGYEKFKRDKNRDFNFERSLRNDNYNENLNYNYNINKRNYNLNTSKVDSIKNYSYYSISGNKSFNNNKKIFNNYTSPFGDYFDSSLQKGGESKLYNPRKNNKGRFKNARSPVKDYIDGLNEVYV